MIVELLTFRVRPGVDEAEVRAREARAYEEFAMQQRGILRRTTAKGHDGEWLVVHLWADLASAEAAEAAAGAHPATAALHELAEPGSLSTRRYEDLGG